MHSYSIGVFCKNQDLEDSLIFRIGTMLMHRSVDAIPKASMTDIRGDSRACQERQSSVFEDDYNGCALLAVFEGLP